jgi:hypothetical protein
MHERLYALMRQHLTVRLTVPQGSKTRKPESDSVGKYHGGPKFNELEDWLTNLVVMFKAEQYSGRDRDRERVLHVLQFLDGEARKWYHRHVVNVRRSQLVWTFEEVIIGLYDRFIHPSTMQDARNTFSATRYTEEMGIQGFYDTLMDHAQNMAVYPDTYQIVVTFLQKIPSYIRTRMFQDGLSPEVNTIDDFISEAKRHETVKKTQDYYDKDTPSRMVNTTKNGVSRNDTNRAPYRTTGTTPARRQMNPIRTTGEVRQVAHNTGNAQKETSTTRSHPKWAEHNKEKVPTGNTEGHDKHQHHNHTAGKHCYNCGRLGHMLDQCKEPRKTQARIRAAHTEIPHDPHDADDELQDADEVIYPQDTDHESVYPNKGEEYVSVDVREYVQGNSHYEWDTDTEFLAPMTDRVMKPEGMIKAIDNDGQKNGAVKVRKAVMRASKTART